MRSCFAHVKTVCSYVTKLIAPQSNRIQVLWVYLSSNAFVDHFSSLAYVSRSVLWQYTVSAVHFYCLPCRSSIYCNKFYIWKTITNLWTTGLIKIPSNILNYSKLVSFIFFQMEVFTRGEFSFGLLCQFLQWKKCVMVSLGVINTLSPTSEW